jgi:hypothetical protein
MYHVHTQVPLPTRRLHSSDRARKYPFHEMEVGDMFFVPNAKRKTLASHATATGRKIGRKFSSRQITMIEAPDGSWQPCDPAETGAVHGIGIWRVK